MLFCTNIHIFLSVSFLFFVFFTPYICYQRMPLYLQTQCSERSECSNINMLSNFQFINRIEEFHTLMHKKQIYQLLRCYLVEKLKIDSNSFEFSLPVA